MDEDSSNLGVNSFEIILCLLENRKSEFTMGSYESLIKVGQKVNLLLLHLLDLNHLLNLLLLIQYDDLS